MAWRFGTIFSRHAPVTQEKNVAPVPGPGWIPTLGSTPSVAGVNISASTSMGVSTVYACVTIRAQDFARCTPRLYAVDDETGERVENKTHPLAKLFRRPNRVQTWFEFAQQMEAAALLRGNAYAAKKRDARGNVVELIPIHPDAVLILEGGDGGVFYNVNRIGLWQIAMLREFPPTIPAEDILHIRAAVSFNALIAVSPIHLARDSIGLAMGLEQQAARFVGNGARPSIVLEVAKALNDVAKTRLKAAFMAVASGLHNTGSTVVLEEGITAKPLQLSSVDLEFMAQRNFSVTDIARWFRVPPHKLGAEMMRGVNTVQVDQDYVNNTVMPDLHMWEEKLSREFDLDETGLIVDMDETALLRADIVSRYNAARVGLMSGFLKVNEVRAGEGLPPVEGGDVLLQPLNMAAAGSHAAGVKPDGGGHPEDGTIPAENPDGAAPRSEN